MQIGKFTRKKIIVCFVISLLLLDGCVVGPDYQVEQLDPVTLSQSLDQKMFSNDHFQSEWWTQFKDPQLNKAVKLALSNNQDIKIAEARVLESRALLDQRELDVLPTITGSAYHAKSISQENSGTEGERNNSAYYSSGLDMQWEIDLFGRIRRLSESARASSQASVDDLVQTQIIIISDVAYNYFQMRGAQKKLDIAQQHLVNRTNTVRLVEAMVFAGRSQKDELASAKADLENVKASLTPLREQFYLSRFRLAVLLGLRTSEIDQILPNRALPTVITRLPIGDINELLRHRPDVASAERRLAASTADVGAATADLYPRINLGGFLGFVAIRGGEIPDASSRAFSLMPSINWTAFHFATAKAKQREAKARLLGVEASYKRVILQAVEEVEGALMSYSQTQQRLQALMSAVLESRRAARLAQIRYTAGKASFLTNLDAQRTQLLAEQTLAEADTQTFIDVVKLYKALGGAW